MPVRVRRARPGDADAIAEVHVRTWQAAYEHVFGAERLAAIDAERRRAWWARCIEEGLETVFVAEHDGTVVAFAAVGESGETPGLGELYAIYALPESWGAGAGPALIEAAADALRRAGYTSAVLWVLADNPRARRFYEREGWALDGQERRGEHLGVETHEVRYRRDL
jgi:GNAT superfamily N-acetyltransferase